ncbi:MAG: TlyA family RNA methyltransferase [Clostridia bacterium]|nr:TlyA family RNA methyltransferase [Clostridia bacterium]
MRLDKYLQTKFNLKSRTYAENLVLTGKVKADGKTVLKPSFDVGDKCIVEIVDDEKFASQGAYKLEKALNAFSIDVQNEYCLDIGCSNGGFCDVLLRRGADKILAVDVAECALDDSVLKSGKVEFLRANARELPLDNNLFDFVCSDVSFISLTYILGEIFRVLKPDGDSVVLIKPQFELDKSALDKNGIVKTEKLRERAKNTVTEFATNLGFKVLGVETAPIRYQNKNVEYLLYLKKQSAPSK